MRLLPFSTTVCLLLLAAGCGKKEDAISTQCRDIVFTQNVTDPDLRILPPNVITPNGDGLNDAFFPYAYYNSRPFPQAQPVFTIRRLSVTRVNNGQVVYASQSYQNDFDGHDSAGQELPEGDYLYDLTLDGNSAQGSVKIARTFKPCQCRAIDVGDRYLESNCP